ncbi:nucleotide pyrophosphohydrolase [Boudabousia marimammalium]|uniref:Nucleotide pyrophosphohydrolase n=1 Tax=Boudabousia marimammalium TaxID=156892 RepID=A0A1Q5PSE7_9ACTO|nr:nucleotide pyrophosphohydrolase [Boudabousia marimammalium]OKL50501.1 hypothetical protein BM477_00565 [Boudabousia marimammalium]
MSEIEELRLEMKKFIEDRDWAKFHDPKAILLAMMGEMGELAECFQWLPADRAAELVAEGEAHEAVSDEIADVFIFLLHLCTACDINLEEATRRKIAKNIAKYPLDSLPKRGRQAAEQ